MTVGNAGGGTDPSNASGADASSETPRFENSFALMEHVLVAQSTVVGGGGPFGPRSKLLTRRLTCTDAENVPSAPTMTSVR